MFRRKVKEDPTELQLLKIRVQNLEKQIAEMKRAPQVQAEEQKNCHLKIANFSLEDHYTCDQCASSRNNLT